MSTASPLYPSSMAITLSHLIPCHAIIVRQLKNCNHFHQRPHLRSDFGFLNLRRLVVTQLAVALPCHVTDFQTRPSVRGRSWHETTTKRPIFNPQRHLAKNTRSTVASDERQKEYGHRGKKLNTEQRKYLWWWRWRQVIRSTYVSRVGSFNLNHE